MIEKYCRHHHAEKKEDLSSVSSKQGGRLVNDRRGDRITVVNRILSYVDIQIVSDHLLRSKERLNRILAQNTGRTVAEIEAATERDNYLSAEEALAFGLIDEIISEREKI